MVRGRDKSSSEWPPLPTRPTDAGGGGGAISAERLFQEQVAQLNETHFLVLLWAAQGEDRRIRYNITNVFDDLKSAGVTRTKQTAVAAVDALHVLRFVTVREEGNRKNIYITRYGAKALEALVVGGAFTSRRSAFVEGQ
ncbi:MAG: hypothetical protein A3K19_17955 [Lentisphaerae bacterium RIFOXYB12_FULL_65_16]|nr:MAG: hypothetical protein A3K18_11045 [Lentisphaerae bacterium RIFOXYA12_64_32]OGV87122.1 MAG: hypothetical protein A3K19_17955 [Lentisphaerae bacterium RIFOXYB12_FULL_65_16]